MFLEDLYQTLPYGLRHLARRAAYIYKTIVLRKGFVNLGTVLTDKVLNIYLLPLI